MQPMTKRTDQGSAKVYQFPLRGRFAASIHGADAKAAPMLAAQAVNAALGSGWYHDEAIQEANRAHKDCIGASVTWEPSLAPARLTLGGSGPPGSPQYRTDSR